MMERFSPRENVVLGYSSQRSLIDVTTSSSKPLYRNDDVDFTDVFGGPPRRSSSNHEIRYSFNEAMDSCSMNGDGEGRRAWSELGEKPVFGEEILSRRRYPSDDFFDDIFRGDESSHSTPRSHDRSTFGSPSGSRVLSPSRPVPPSGSSSLPGQFSLPAKLTKGMDLPTFGSSSRSPNKYKDGNDISTPFSSSVTLSRFSSEVIRSQEETKNYLTSSYQSPSSLETSLSSRDSLNFTRFDETETINKLKRNSSCSEVSTNINQFHFSIYKWPSAGVPVMMPLRVGNNSRSKINGSIERENVTRVIPEDTSPNIDSSFFDDRMSTNTMSFRMGKEQEGNDLMRNRSTQNRAEPYQVVDKSIFTVPESETTSSLQTIVKTVTNDTILQNMEDRSIGLCGKIDKDIHVVIQDTLKPELRTVSSLFDDKYDEPGQDEASKKSGGKETPRKSTKKLYVNVDLKKDVNKEGQKTPSDSAEVKTAIMQASPVSSGNKFGSSRFKGKVEEFVKIFDQEASLKPTVEVNSRSHSSRWKDKDALRTEKEASVGTATTNEKMQPSVDKNKTSSDSFVKVDDDLKVSEKKNSAIKTSNKLSSDTSFGPKDNLASSTESIHNRSTSIAGDIDDLFQHEFLIQEILEDESKLVQPNKDNEELQAADTKIRKWSNGKEGNIRSLLSTLQYVLWPESGWRPVPLVDIIEGNAVKRAYQKALLCLHPDKLQQKGAASHQKYVAEKVFDILQEAWSNFNSLSSLS